MIGDDDEDAWLEFRVDAAISAEGAAADSADDQNKEFEGLPRILRYALLARRMNDHNVAFRLVADIDDVRPGLAQSKAWSSVRSEATAWPSLLSSTAWRSLAICPSCEAWRIVCGCYH